MEITPKGNSENNCSIVKWSFEYEKMNGDTPEPNIFFDLVRSSAAPKTSAPVLAPINA